MLRGIGRLRAGGGLDRAIYAIFATQDGYFRDPSDLSTSYQDSAGTTAGAVDSAVGLMLDKSDGATGSLGSDIVAYTVGGTSGANDIQDLGNNTFRWVGDGSTFSFVRFTVTLGRGYFIEPTVISRTAGAIKGNDATDSDILSGFTATPSPARKVITTKLEFGRQTAGVAIDITVQFRIREIPGNHTTQSTGGSRPLLKLVSGYYGDQFDGLDDYVVSTSGGGGSAGFFYCGAVYVGGGAGALRSIWSDRGTSTGYQVRVSDLNVLQLLAGNGSVYTIAATGATLPVGEAHIVTAWDDGTNLNVQVDNGTVATVARPAVSAGSAGFYEGQNGSASQYFPGRLGTRVYFKNYCPDAATREQIKRYIAIRSGVSL